MTPKPALVCLLAPVLMQAASTAHAASTILVPSQQATIQGAIDRAVDGDTVLVSPGTYLENIDFKGKAISVRAAHPGQPTIIDGQSLGPVVTFHNGEGARSILNGFTIQHGQTASGAAPCFYEGGGVCIVSASPTIRGNQIVDNSAPGGGGGIDVEAGAPLIADNYIARNLSLWSGSAGGGIHLYNTTSVRILGNTIEANHGDFGGGIAMFSGGTPTVTGNILRGNIASEGGAIWIVNWSNPYISQNLIDGNTAGSGAGIYWTVPQGWRGPYLVNNTLEGNTGYNGSPGQTLYADGFDPNAKMFNNLLVAGPGQTAVYCGVYDHNPPNMTDNDVYSGGLAYEGNCADQTHRKGNISADPLFVSASTGDYHLQALSPAIDVGYNAAPRLGSADFDGVTRILDGNGDGTAVVDMGAFEFKAPRTAATSAGAPRARGGGAPAGDASPASSRRYESVGRDGRRTVQYVDANGRPFMEIDGDGVYHRVR